MIRRQRSSSYDSIIPPHLISINNIGRELVDELLMKAEDMKSIVLTKGGCDKLKYRVLASLFYEPSTRTSCSFTAAMQRLGGTVISVNEQQSSAAKGETLEDTIQTMCCYCDAIVIRHPMKGSSDMASKFSSKPVINAGDGTGEHPTQALLDIYTIKSELGTIGFETTGVPMVITLLGDLKHGRTVHSLVKLLLLYTGIKLVFISPPTLSLPNDIIKELDDAHIEHITMNLIDEAISMTDVLYVTRIQKERFNSIEEYEDVAGSYCIDANTLKKAKNRMIVMHPLPRNNEISKEIDHDPRAAYFRQMEYGMYMRMAILDLFMKRNEVEF